MSILSDTTYTVVPYRAPRPDTLPATMAPALRSIRLARTEADLTDALTDSRPYVRSQAQGKRAALRAEHDDAAAIREARATMSTARLLDLSHHEHSDVRAVATRRLAQTRKGIR